MKLILNNEKQWQSALVICDLLMDAKPNTKEEIALDVLSEAIDKYETRVFFTDMPPLPNG